MNIRDLSNNAAIRAAEKVKGNCADHRARAGLNDLCEGCIFVGNNVGCRINYPYEWSIPAKVETKPETPEAAE